MFDCYCFIERWFLKIEDMQKYYVFDIMRLKVKAGLIQFQLVNHEQKYMHPVFKDKVFWFFIIKISVWLFFSIIWIHSVKEWESSWFLLIMLIVIIGYTIRNFILFLSYFRYCDKIFRTNLPHKTGTCFLQIFLSPVKTTVLMKSNTVSIEIEPKKVMCKFILLRDCLYLFFSYKTSVGDCKLLPLSCNGEIEW